MGASRVREKLGESLLSVQKYDVPLESVPRLRWRRYRPTVWAYQAQVMKND